MRPKIEGSRAEGGLRGEGKPSPLRPFNTRRWGGEYKSERVRPFKSTPISPSPPSSPRVKNNSRSTVRNASLGENLGKRRPPRVLALDRARQSCAPGQRTPYDVQITLDAQETTRFKQHPPSLRAQEKMEIRFTGGVTSDPQVRWFCARSFKTAVGSRLKDPEASEGLV